MIHQNSLKNITSISSETFLVIKTFVLVEKVRCNQLTSRAKPEVATRTQKHLLVDFRTRTPTDTSCPPWDSPTCAKRSFSNRLWPACICKQISVVNLAPSTKTVSHIAPINHSGPGPVQPIPFEFFFIVPLKNFVHGNHVSC